MKALLHVVWEWVKTIFLVILGIYFLAIGLWLMWTLNTDAPP